MEGISALGLALLEMVFVFVTLMLMHGLRKLIGSASFYISMGLLLVFAHIISTAGLEIRTGMWGGSFQISSVSLFLPSIAALLVIYISDGTLATQRLIVGVIASLGFYTYLSVISRAQCNWEGYIISKGPTADSVEYLLLSSQKSMAVITLTMIMDLFLLPIFFQRLRNLQCRLFFCCLGALLFTQLADALMYASITYWGTDYWLEYMISALTVRSIAVLILSILTALYLARIEKEIPGEGRGALDIVFAFFGGYGKAKALQVHINEWEDRYRMVVENASEMILLLDRKGQIMDANVAACRIMRLMDKAEITGKYFPSIFFDHSGKPLLWNEHYMSFSDGKRNLNSDIECYVNLADGEKIEVSVTLSEIDFENMKMLIVVGRDVTEQHRLAREKDDLTMQLAHAQRLESIGQLAGGVAHDFNNYLHSIIGHLDVVKYIYKIKDESVIKHVDKVIEISEQAAKLTQQLLGFARKGKYVEKVLDLSDLVKQSVELFVPRGQECVDIKVQLPPKGIMIKGDMVQLQQVMLNLLLNARDATAAVRERESVICISSAKADKMKIKLSPPPEMKKQVEPEKFYCISIKDNGEGIDAKIAERIFEPFFTTKPMGKGTGMGLSMVYGAVFNHGGWVQFESAKGEGATFHIFLPVFDPATDTLEEVEV